MPGSTAGSFLQLVSLLIVFALVMALTYFVTKWIAKYGNAGNASTNIDVIETYRLSANRFIAIIRLGKEKYVACAVSKDHVALLAELAADELTFYQGSGERPSGFRDILGRIRNNREERGAENENEKAAGGED